MIKQYLCHVRDRFFEDLPFYNILLRSLIFFSYFDIYLFQKLYMQHQNSHGLMNSHQGFGNSCHLNETVDVLPSNEVLLHSHYILQY